MRPLGRRDVPPSVPALPPAEKFSRRDVTPPEMAECKQAATLRIRLTMAIKVSPIHHKPHVRRDRSLDRLRRP
jgi:hypothetical protein